MISCRAWNRVPKSARPLGHLWHKECSCYRQKCWEPRRRADKNSDKVPKRTHFSSKVCLTGLISQSILITIFFRINLFHCKFSITSESDSITISLSFCFIFFCHGNINMSVINERVVIKNVFHVHELMYCPLQDEGIELMNERSWLFCCLFGIFWFLCFGFFFFFQGEECEKRDKTE